MSIQNKFLIKMVMIKGYQSLVDGPNPDYVLYQPFWVRFAALNSAREALKMVYIMTIAPIFDFLKAPCAASPWYYRKTDNSFKN